MKFSLFAHMERVNEKQKQKDLYDEFISLCKIADEGGMCTVWTGEHHGMDLTIAPNPFLNLIDLSHQTCNVRLGTGTVVAPYWHPIKLAGEAAMTDIITDGRLDIGIAMWSHPDSGYLMSPELCARVAELPNIVAIKYSVPREMYVKLTHLVGDKIHVSTASEAEWLDNIEELGWKLYLCSSPPYQLQTRNDRRMNDYTRLAFEGHFAEARKVRDSLNPVREAMKSSRPADKPQAFGKYWLELLGQTGGRVRRPMLELTEAEKSTIRTAFQGCGLQL